MAGGPIYPMSNIMLTYFKIFTLAREKLYITNPYFIPNESILDALKQAALSGVDVRLLVPKKSDSLIVGLSARSYFDELLDAGVRIFLYKKGFVHAKTVVADDRLSIVGTANMDIRSFDLNFEVMSVIYSVEFAKDMTDMFENDLTECEEIDPETWQKRGFFTRLKESLARLSSAFL
jgi:cardiolipin synthase